MNRQSLRRSILVVSMLLMPVVINYYSPILIIQGSMERIMSGSFVFFGLLLLSSLVFGRAYCGWLCPFSGYMEALAYANPKNTNSRRGHLIKWTYWVIWIGIILYIAVTARGYDTVNILYQTENIISVDEPGKYIFLYYPVLGVATFLNLAIGKRAWCHYICWAGNFSAVGSKIRKKLGLPSLHLESGNSCISCKTCNRVCSKSLDVHGGVQKRDLSNSECILCGNCVYNCPKGNIRYAWRWRGAHETS